MKIKRRYEEDQRNSATAQCDTLLDVQIRTGGVTQMFNLSVECIYLVIATEVTYLYVSIDIWLSISANAMTQQVGSSSDEFPPRTNPGNSFPLYLSAQGGCEAPPFPTVQLCRQL